jgi:Uncharacterized phage-encoded protein
MNWEFKEVRYNYHKLQVIKEISTGTVYVSIPSACKSLGLDFDYWNYRIRKGRRDIYFSNLSKLMPCIDIAYVPAWVASVDIATYPQRVKEVILNAFAVSSISQKKTNAQTIAEVAKVLQTGRDRLFRWLRREGILKYNNVPYQEYIDQGYFIVKDHGRYVQTLVQSKGVPFIADRISRYLG